MSATQEDKELRDAWQYFWELLKLSEVNEWEEADESEREELRIALLQTHAVFWKKSVDDPKVGERWYVKVTEENLNTVKIVAVDQAANKYGCQGYNTWGHTIVRYEDRSQLVARVPPMFPRLHKLFSRLFSFMGRS